VSRHRAKVAPARRSAAAAPPQARRGGAGAASPPAQRGGKGARKAAKGERR
jgi:hypothetical protein